VLVCNTGEAKIAGGSAAICVSVVKALESEGRARKTDNRGKQGAGGRIYLVWRRSRGTAQTVRDPAWKKNLGMMFLFHQPDVFSVLLPAVMHGQRALGGGTGAGDAGTIIVVFRVARFVAACKLDPGKEVIPAKIHNSAVGLLCRTETGTECGLPVGGRVFSRTPRESERDLKTRVVGHRRG